MKRVITYLIVLALLFFAGMIYCLIGFPTELENFRLPAICSLIGGLGGVLYCARGVYLNRAVHNSWDDRWLVWYGLRPLVSLGCGAVSYLFLKAGLLVLEAGTKADATDMGFYAFAFIAGYNVDKFLEKIEDISKSIWGIEKSRVGKSESNGENK